MKTLVELTRGDLRHVDAVPASSLRGRSGVFHSHGYEFFDLIGDYEYFRMHCVTNVLRSTRMDAPGGGAIILYSFSLQKLEEISASLSG